MGKFDTLKSLGTTHCIVPCYSGRFWKKLSKNYEIVFFNKSMKYDFQPFNLPAKSIDMYIILIDLKKYIILLLHNFF